MNSARKYVKIKHIKESGVLNMAKISKDTIPEHTKNIKINTRIMITSVLAIIIPIIIISTAASIFFYTSKDKYDFTSVTVKATP